MPLCGFIPVFLLSLSLSFLQACASHSSPLAVPSHRAVLAVGPAGQVLSGSKASLEQAVRNGCGLRVGFGVDPNHDGKMEIEHWADAMFVSIYHGEVFAQLAPIQEQRAKPGAPAIYFGTSPHPWIGMLDTTGHLAGWFPNEEPSELAVTSWWYVGGC